MVAGIVCEYNPFHKGHLYQLEKTKEHGADAVVCVMSGNYVQRGECAAFDKWSRAEAAVRSGADVVIDLPVPWAVSSAENFARGSVFLLKEFGIDFLSFGSEYDDREKLLLAAKSVDDEAVVTLAREYMQKGMSYPVSLHKAVSELYGNETAELISSPNSTLAVEYIRQLNKYEGIDFLPVRRIGADHDSDEMAEGFPSASKIRQLLTQGQEVYSFLPEGARGVLLKAAEEGLAPCLMINNERGVLSSLRELSREKLEEYISDEKGLAGRIYDAVRVSCSLDELYEKAKSKNYTLSRIRREVLGAYLGIPKELSLDTPPYIRILAVSERGLSLLSKAKKNSALPIVTKHSEMQNLSDKSRLVYEIQCSSTDKLALFLPSVRECGLEQKSSMIRVPAVRFDSCHPYKITSPVQ